ncbi:eukaryotic aspartyl protease family protein [Actinidia rufa]|uniref:Eukaryotic aspartyl protease family protein n=1 Tax=Actinidia rufa TaxID=165716 RepID=A0A7J0GL70_9ERIC|nr:eukaryotic aspartyl protease family protein [Actinidia rufa]
MVSISFSLLCTLCLVVAFLIKAQAFGFTADLIHRDSPQSPFYNPLSTKMDRLNNAIKRSFSRAAHLKQSLCQSHSPNTIQSEIIPDSGEYLMKLSIGTPPVETLGIADTGSDLTWTQCKPCRRCYKQKAPLFNPKNSSTYRELSCHTGTIATETFTLGSTSSRPVSVPKMIFGCGHHSGGTFNNFSTGIIGLGGGSFSLVSQLGVGKFSYCLSGFFGNETDVTINKINFGDNAAMVSGSGVVVSTPIIPNEISTFYYLTLKNIMVGNKTLTHKTKMKSSNCDNNATADHEQQAGNIIIDSGTTLTLLPSHLYRNLESQLRKTIKAKPSKDPQGLLGLCYSDTNIDLPNITFKFTGAELELPPMNTFVRRGKLVCLGMVPSDDIAIFGNLNQINVLIGYDLVKKQLSFMPTDCRKINN